MNSDPGLLKLMIPGPVQPEEEVLAAMGAPVRPHYGSEWTAIYKETTELMKKVFMTEGEVFLMVGSGSAGIDACMGSALASGEKILVGANGFFGERLVAIAEGYGLLAVPVRAAEGQPLESRAFEAALSEHPDAVAVALVHLETSTTVVNPVESIAHLAQASGLVTIVDAVSSLGGLPFEMDAWGIDLSASASQKCLGAPPGLAPVAVGPGGWRAIDRHPHSGHGWYLSLRTWRQYAQDWGSWHPFPVTMATNNVMALRASLSQLLAEGVGNRLDRYRQLALRLRRGLRSIGMEPFTPDEIMAPVLTAAWCPEGIEASELVDYMAERHQTKISTGLGERLAQRLIRIGHMAPTVGESDIDELLLALREFKPDWRRIAP